MTGTTWLDRLQCLLARFPGTGIGPDIGAMPIADLWGVYRLLEALAARHATAP